ncbi:hypothetical protein [Streptomyces sp. NPDC006289]
MEVGTGLGLGEPAGPDPGAEDGDAFTEKDLQVERIGQSFAFA